MAEYSTTLYDTAVFTANAGVEHLLFQMTQGGDATHTESFTNMRGNGSLPQQESFIIDTIKAIIDSVILIADVPKILYGSFLEIRLSDENVFRAPLSMCVAHSSWNGSVNLAAAADKPVIGLEGKGFPLKLPILVEGGTSFRVRLFQSLALSAATANVKIVLEGTLKTSR